METKHYKKSFLLFLHILLSVTLTVLTYFLVMEYVRKDKIIGIVLSLFMLYAYFFLLKYAVRVFTQQKLGMAYLISIGGFLIVTFLQITTCANIIPFGT